MADDLQSLRQALAELDGSADVHSWIGSNLERIVREVLERVAVQLEDPQADDPSLSMSFGAMTSTYVDLFSIMEESFRWHYGADNGGDPFLVLSQSYNRWKSKRRLS